MIGLVYFIVIILANTVGAISGMGGGVIIKPILDTIGAHSTAAISFYSSVAVFTMSVVSTLRQVRNGVSVHPQKAVLLSIGAIVGGVIGNSMFELLLEIYPEEYVQLIQMSLTALTLVVSFYFAKYGGREHRLNHPFFLFLGGIFLGGVASLLGIGGGPINITVLMLFFALPIREATVYSIVTIFFSQFSKLVTIAVTTGFSRFDLSLLFYVVPAAILGGFIGAGLSGRLAPRKIVLVYQIVVASVLGINVYNIVQILSAMG